MSRESDESVVRHQDLEEGGHHQEGRGRSHHDRKESPSGKRGILVIVHKVSIRTSLTSYVG